MYVKLFSDLLDSSLWTEDSDTRIVWVTILMLADQDGLVRATLPGIAHRARVSLEATAKALTRFESPDANSRTPDYEGKRIERIDGGYLVLNYKKYRDLHDEDSRREYMRQYMQKRRAREEARKQPQVAVTPIVTPVNSPVNSRKLLLAHTDTDTEAEAETTKDKSASKPPTCPFSKISKVWNEFAGKNSLPKVLQLTKERKARLRQRWHVKHWRDTWQSALQTIPQSKFLLGQNDRGWRANFDWFVRPDTVNKLLEDQYDGSNRAGSTSGIGASRPRNPDEPTDKFVGR